VGIEHNDKRNGNRSKSKHGFEEPFCHVAGTDASR